MQDDTFVTDILLDVPGVKPASQRRSLQKRDAMLKAGLDLLRDTEFEQLSIQQITAEARCSVGSFYERFEDKDSFLLALQKQVYHRQIEDARARLAPADWARVPTHEAIAAAVTVVSDSFRGDAEGLLRAAMVRSAAKPHVWGPSRASSKDMSDVLKAVLVDRLDGPDPEGRVDVAIQLLNGILLNMILRDPGPLRLSDPKTDRTLTDITVSVLGPLK
ncbi:MAG: TetR/AcrR family transcriptional regulator [Pseudomonadota bacterium]